jgi:hypothetical protein
MPDWNTLIFIALTFLEEKQHGTKCHTVRAFCLQSQSSNAEAQKHNTTGQGTTYK